MARARINLLTLKWDNVPLECFLRSPSICRGVSWVSEYYNDTVPTSTRTHEHAYPVRVLGMPCPILPRFTVTISEKGWFFTPRAPPPKYQVISLFKLPSYRYHRLPPKDLNKKCPRKSLFLNIFIYLLAIRLILWKKLYRYHSPYPPWGPLPPDIRRYHLRNSPP